MKIGIFSTLEQSPWGGSELLWLQMAQAAARAGHGLCINVNARACDTNHLKSMRAANCNVYARAPRKTLYNLDGKARWNAALTGTMKVPLAGESELEDYAPIMRWLDSNRPDVVLISQSFFTDGYNIRQACIDRKTPFVSLIQSAADSVWLPADTATAYSRQYEAAAALVSVSERMLNFLRFRFGVDLERGIVIHNPVNLQNRSAVPWPNNSDALHMACVGRLECVQKGQDLLIQAAASPRLSGLPIHLHFYGDGPDEAYLKAAAQRSGLSQVTFHGYATDIREIWSNCHALILPSRYEGQPLAVAEAMVCGRPVIVTDVMGAAELVEDGTTGFVAAAATSELIGAALHRAWEHRHNLEAMGAVANAKALAALPEHPHQDLLEVVLSAVVAA